MFVSYVISFLFIEMIYTTESGQELKRPRIGPDTGGCRSK